MVRAVFWGVRQAICTETCRGSRPFADRFLEGWLCPKCWLSVPLIDRWLELFGAHRVLPPSSVNGKSLWCVLLYWGCGKSSWKWLGTRLKLVKLKIIAKSFRSFWMLVSPIGESGPSTTVAFIFPESVLDMVGPMSPFVVILEKIAGKKHKRSVKLSRRKETSQS